MSGRKIDYRNMAGSIQQQVTNTDPGKPENEIDYLNRQLEKANAVISEQQAELLGLYRRLNGQDRPEAPY